MLYTLDEARAEVVQSAAHLLHAVSAEATVLERLLRGERRGVQQLRPHERALAAAHRMLLEDLREAGYDWAVDDELDGICSAVFNDHGFQPALLFEQAADRLLRYPAA